MGLQDRGYFQDHQRQSGWGGERYERRGLPHLPRTVVGWLLLINIAVYLFDGLTASSFASTYGKDSYGNWIRFTDWLSLSADQIYHPIRWYRFLTCGFAHAPQPAHIICNMLVLFFFGPTLERKYGAVSFLFFYLFTIVTSALFWSAGLGFGPEEMMVNGQVFSIMPQMYGASGAVTGLVVLFALNYPKQQAYWFFIPMPMWLVATFILVADMSGMLGHPINVHGGSGLQNIAFSAHIGGALTAFLWWKFCSNQRWYLRFIEGVTPARWRWQRMGTGRTERNASSNASPREEPRSRASRDTENTNPGATETDTRDSLNAEVDRILAKYSSQGAESLTDAEKRTLQRASEVYRGD